MTQTLTRRQFTTRLAAAAALPAGLGCAWAMDARPIRIMVGFPPGGGSDAIARLLADKLKDELKRPVVVENRPGAGGQLAAQLLKAAPAVCRWWACWAPSARPPCPTCPR